MQLPGATSTEIATCEQRLGIAFPDDFKAFLQHSNGFNDALGEGYLVIWSADELAAAEGYEIFAFTPERFLFGSNAGPTAYAYIDGAYCSIPFVAAGPWQSEMRALSDTFSGFLTAIAAGEGY
jgi:hypothetical protein